MPKRKTFVATGAVATGLVAASIIAYVVSTGTMGNTRFDTSLDASSNTTPPKDWRSGYARTGTICYSQDATGTTSACFAANVLPYTTDATDVGWPIEPTAVNRFPTNEGMACGGAPWDCSTATMDSTSTAPDGGSDASTVTFGGGSIDATAFGYGNNAALDFRIWAKCPGTGTLDASHIGGTGHWTVDATAMGTGWRLLYPARAEVTEVQAFQSDGSGGLRLRLSGVDCTFWQPTATEQVSTWHHSTIPTSDATGSTVGNPVWSIDNTTGAYWATSGVTKVETLSEYSGTCWNYSGTTIKLTGSSTCTATWYGLSLTWGY